MDQSQNDKRTDPVKSATDDRAESISERNPPPLPDGRGSEAAPPLTPAAWLMSNGPWLLLFAVLLGLAWYKLGLEGVWSIAKVVVGLGLVIFIHELGHFLAAKWCDVHVQTFSIGFGPALPGCSFQRGETTYKISAIPLGGYVNMIGEGPEADEDENYPRSFKNKTVGQRMVIISAGVVMNVLLGCVLFIAVYYYHGIDERAAIVGRVDPGSPLWEKGIASGSLITNIDGIRNPVFKNLQRKVILSGKDEVLPFTFAMYGPNGEKEGERTVDLLPRKGENDQNPVVGVLSPQQLRLESKPSKLKDAQPVVRGSAAAAARVLPLKEGEVVVAASDPDHPEKMKSIDHDLSAGTYDYDELGKRFRALEGKKLLLHVRPKGGDKNSKAEERDVPLQGFQFNDSILGCTDPHQPAAYNPFRIAELPRDPRHAGGDRRDPFVFHARLRQLAGRPMIVRVRRGDPDNTDPRRQSSTGEVVDLFVPPAFHTTLGMRMKMGKVAGLRDDSPAKRAEVHKGDELIGVVMKDEHGSKLFSSADLDPERLPSQLAEAAAKVPGKKQVILTVRREPPPPNNAPQQLTLSAVEWQERWDNDEEIPLTLVSPMAIPQLGLAYWVHSMVVEVDQNSPAAAAGLKKGDTITAVRYKSRSVFSENQEPDWERWSELESKRNGSNQYDCWANVFLFLQYLNYKEIQVKVSRPGEKMEEPLTLIAREDLSWPLTQRGLHLMADTEVQKADSFGEALVMGGRESYEMVGLMYLQLRSLATRRVSIKQVGGPIAMLSQGFFIAQSGNYELLLFLAAISINLAVVNFLPIPILDGGHMVFLIYEKLRGRPPAENVRIAATYVGLAMIVLLMVFVFYQDFQNYVLRMLNI